MEKIRQEKMNVGDLIVDWDVNPRDKSQETIDEFADIMIDYQSKALTFDESWKQKIEATEDKIVVRGSHSLVAAKEVYGDHHQITVLIHVGVTGKEKAAFLSATSNVHGKPYKQGERRKAIFEVLGQTQNLKRGIEADKRGFLSIREISAITGISKGYIYELRRDYRAENGLENESGEIHTVEDLALIRQQQRNKSAGKPDEVPVTPEQPQAPAPTPEPTQPQVISIPSKEELDKMSQEELFQLTENMRKAKDDTKIVQEPTPTEPAAPETPTPDKKVEKPKPDTQDNEDDTDESEETYASEEAYDIDSSDYLTNVEKDGYVEEEQEKKDAKPPRSKSTGIKAEVIGDTDVITVSEKQLKKQMLDERKEAMQNITDLMEDFKGIESIEALESINLYRGEIEVTRDEDSIWEEPFDEDVTGRDTIGSILLGILDLLEEEYKKYSNNAE